MLRITLIILFVSSLSLKSQNQIDTLVLNPNEILSIQIKKVNPKNAFTKGIEIKGKSAFRVYATLE